MELGSREGAEIPMAIPSTTGFRVAVDHLQASPNTSRSIEEEEEITKVSLTKEKKTVRYGECLKNHAAAMGGNATDGCGEFMPGGAEGSLEALKCGACGCHRNFHRREMGADLSSSSCSSFHMSHGIIHGDPLHALSPSNFLVRTHPHLHPHPQMTMSSMSTGPSESDDYEGGFMTCHAIVKKRFRTKFTQQQREKMLDFAQRLGWKIQKHDESAVQQFCQEIGVQRRVLKVWMHNNKHTQGKKNLEE